MVRGLKFYLFLILLISICSCSESQTNDEHFYIGLTDKENAVSHFEKALSSRNEFIRRASAQELCVLMSEGNPLSSRTMRRIKNELNNSESFKCWAQALDSVNNKEKALSFLLNINHNTQDKARNFVLNRNISMFDNYELALIYGHHSVFRYRYNEALSYFGTFKKDGNWPDSLPEIFLSYPHLISDLGRAFQYTASASEGMALFLKWEENINTGESSLNKTEAKYRLLFFAARIARRIGLNEEAKALFEKALLTANEHEQKDACIWYILDLSLVSGIDILLLNIEKYISSWDSPSYFNDILERLLQMLAEKHDWNNIIRAYSIIKDKCGSVESSYAFVIYRIIIEGYKATPENRSKYLFDCYNKSENEFSDFLYYRHKSASLLNRPLFADMAPLVPPQEKKNTQALQFINGFFLFNAEDYALAYIHQLENELSIEELREAANLLEQYEMYPHIIRLVTRYMKRDGYNLAKRDIELLFPVPFKELVDKYADEYNIAPEILFGLIRTESAFQHKVSSHAGAVGLAQLLPDTADEMAGRLRRAGGSDYTGDNFNLTDPDQNIHLGAYYLNYLNDRFEDDLLSLLAYNGGMNRIRRMPSYGVLPPDLFMETIHITETREYGKKVLGAAAAYKELYY